MGSFTECHKLVNVTIEGTIGKNWNISGAPKLSHDSLMNIIGCLKDYSEDTSGTTRTLTLGSANIEKLTTEELDTIIQKGWTYA
jgi:hypothetical protein